MWFNNALIYQYELEKPMDLTVALTEDILKPCPPHARFIYGWLPAFSETLVHDIIGCSYICLGKEERILPRSVIMRQLDTRIKALETQRGYPVKRAEKAQLAEDLEFELLPKSFCVQKRLPALLDNISKRLIINTASATQASQLTALLRKSIPGIRIEPLHYPEHLAIRFAEWINNPATLPPNFELASDCLLFSLDDEKKRFNCKGYELPAEEIVSLLSQGLVAAEISMVWNERIQFTLTQDFIFKRIKSLDYLSDEMNDIRELDGEEQQRDAALTLLSGELRGLVDALFTGVSEKTSDTPSAKTLNTVVEECPF